jgi:hypothetical protein
VFNTLYIKPDRHPRAMHAMAGRLAPAGGLSGLGY